MEVTRLNNHIININPRMAADENKQIRIIFADASGEYNSRVTFFDQYVVVQFDKIKLSGEIDYKAEYEKLKRLQPIEFNIKYQEEYEKLKKRTDRLDKYCEKIREENEYLKAKVDDVTYLKNRLDEENTGLFNQCKDLKSKIQELEEKNCRLSYLYHDTEKDMDICRRDHIVVVDDLNAIIKDLKAEIEELKNNKKISDELYKEHQKEKKSYINTIKNLEERNYKLLKEVAELKELQNENVKLNVVISNLKDENGRLKNYNNNLEIMNKGILDGIADVVKERDELDHKIEEIRDIIEPLSGGIAGFLIKDIIEILDK